MVSVREFARATATGRTADGETGGMAEDVAEDIEEGEAEKPPTSIKDLTAEADPRSFDRSFTSDTANLTIQGDFDPVAGTKQVIPRVAYTLNFNFVYNPERDRWEPDEGNDGTLRSIENGGTLVTDNGVILNFGNNLSVSQTGSDPVTATVDASGGGGATGGTKIYKSFANVQTVAPVQSAIVDFDNSFFDTLGAGDLANNKIVAQNSGLHTVHCGVTWDPDGDGDTFTAEILINGNEVAAGINATVEGANEPSQLSQTVSDVFDLSAGDNIQVRWTNGEGTNTDILGLPERTWLSMADLS